MQVLFRGKRSFCTVAPSLQEHVLQFLAIRRVQNFKKTDKYFGVYQTCELVIARTKCELMQTPLIGFIKI